MKKRNLLVDTIVGASVEVILFTACFLVFTARYFAEPAPLVSIQSPFSFTGLFQRLDDRSFRFPGTTEVSSASTDIPVENNAQYLVTIRATGIAAVHLDLISPGFISEHYVVPAGEKAREYSYFFSSGGLSPAASFRILSYSKDSVWIRSVQLQRVGMSYSRVRLVLLGLISLVFTVYVMRHRHQRLVQGMVLFVFICFVYFSVDIPENANVGDNYYFVPTAQSLLDEGNIELSEYRQFFEHPPTDRRIVEVNDRVYNIYPVGTSLVVLPFVFASNILAEDTVHRPDRWLRVSAISAKLMAAISVVVLFFILLRLTEENLAVSVVLSLVFAFATCHFSHHAGGLYSHNTGVLLLTIGFLLLLAKPEISWSAAIPFAVGYMARPDFSVAIALYSLFIFLYRRQNMAAYAAVGIALAACFCGHSYATFAHWLPPYHSDPNTISRAHVVEAAIAHLISPNRGLIPFTPVALFSFAGMWLAWRHKSQFAPIYRFLSMQVLAEYIIISLFSIWWGGYSYGPRYFNIVLPAMILLMVPCFQRWKTLKRTSRTIIGAAFVLCVAWGFFVQWRGATSWDTQLWNAAPNVDTNTQRVWDWRDWQPLRGLKIKQ